MNRFKYLLLISFFAIGVNAQSIDKIEAIIGDEIVLTSEVESQYLQYLSQGKLKSDVIKCEIIEDLLLENAKYLLSGYNTMSDEERKKFDIENYLVFFKAFFKKQSVYSFIIFQLSYLSFDDEKSVLIWSSYITAAIIYLLVKSKKFKLKN